MLDTVTAVTTYIEQHHLLPESGTVIVAVSGGADSLCLLHLLHQLCGPGKRYLDIQVHVAHLNHQLRDEAVHDAEAVARLAASWGLSSTIGSIDVPALACKEQRSLEDAARTARYRFLREVARGYACPPDKVAIAVAHHQDDQVETLLLHWLRGGGITGMVGLQPRQQDIIRPLLAVTHADTVEYCRQHGLTPLEDESNTDTRFLRNRIRHELLPVLESMNPGIRETLLRSAQVMHVDAEWIEAQVDAAWSSVVTMEHTNTIALAINALLALPLSLQRHLLRRVTAMLSTGQSPLELRHYRLIEQLMGRAPGGEQLTLHLPNQLHVLRSGDTLMFERIDEHETQPGRAVEDEEVVLPIPGRIGIPGTPWTAVAEAIEETTIVPDRLPREDDALPRKGWADMWRLLPSTRYAVYVDADTVGHSLRIRTRRPGDRIRPLGMAHEKKVQDVLVDKHIARAERAQLPLFFSASHCVWLAGVCLDDRVRLTGETRRVVRLSIVPT